MTASGDHWSSGDPTSPGSVRRLLEEIMGHPLSDAQWTAVTAPAQPGAIVAGAGSGKTTVMSARVLWLVLEGYAQPDHILGLTFTTKAAAELLHRIRGGLARAVLLGALDDQLAESSSFEPAVSTYHSFAGDILGDHGVRLGLEPGARVLADGAREALALSVVRATSLPLASLGATPQVVLSALLHLDDELAELDITPDDLLDHSIDLIADLESLPEPQRIAREMLAAARVRAAVCGLVGEFRAAKAARQVIDFADQIRLALALTRSNSDVVERLRRQFPYVLLDEYQDTSVAQRRLMQQVFGHGHAVTSVGDPCQAIYEWRGASVDNIDRFPEHFPVIDDSGSRPAHRYPLADNRRSAPAILDLANELARPLRGVHAGVEPLRAAATDRGPGVVRCALMPTYRDEIDWVADQVMDLHLAGAAWGEIAILGRTKSMIVDIDDELRARGVPTRLLGVAGLLAVPVVAELRAMLEVIDDPTADASLMRLLAGPRWRIGPRDLAAIGACTGTGPRQVVRDLDDALAAAVLGSDPQERRGLAEVIADVVFESGSDHGISAQARDRLAAMMREISLLRRHASESPAELIARVLRLSGLAVESSIGPDAADNARALAAFREWAARFWADDLSAGGLTAFLARVRDAERFDVDVKIDESTSGDAVQLMTVHKAKGLEFPHVIVPGMYAGGFPSARGRPRWPKRPASVPWSLRDDAPEALRAFPDPDEGPRDKHHKEFEGNSKILEELEERRLAYVAVTRAECTLVASAHWWGPEQSGARGPGTYLEEIRQWCLDHGHDVAAWAQAPAEGEPNPLLVEREVPWPATGDERRMAARLWAARRVRELTGAPADAVPDLSDEQRVRVTGWDGDIDLLLREARRQRAPLAVSVPTDVSASALVRMNRDPESFALDLARPMPRRPHAAARRGTLLHEWIEGQYAVQTLFDLADLDAVDAHIGDVELDRLRAAFARGRYAARTPVALEQPFALALGGHVIRGRIDAVFRAQEGAGVGTDGPTRPGAADSDVPSDARVQIVDWKSGGRRGLDDLQLAIYRLAWSQMTGLDLAQIDAVFYLVASDEVVRPTRLADHEEVVRLLSDR